MDQRSVTANKRAKGSTALLTHPLGQEFMVGLLIKVIWLRFHRGFTILISGTEDILTFFGDFSALQNPFRFLIAGIWVFG